MGATYIGITGMGFDSSLSDMTAMSGGNSFDVGLTGGDFLYFNNGNYWDTGGALTTTPSPTDKETIVRKTSGDERIRITRYTDVGGDPLPAIAALGTTSPTFTYDLHDDKNNTLTAGSFTAGISMTLASSRLNGGVYYTFDLTKNRETFWWLGYSRNGTWSATISLSDASATPVVYNLPVSPFNVATPGYFAASFQGTARQVTNGVTCKVKINRDGVGAGASGAIWLRGQILRTAVPAARPRGTRPGRR